jgi:hypothetical protein
MSDDEPAPVPGRVETSGFPESHVRFTIPEEVVQESATPAPEEPDSREEPAAENQPPVRHPIPPAREIRPIPLNYGIAAVLILAIALAGAWIFLQVPGPGAVDIPLTPAATMTPAISHPPATMPTTAAHPVTTAITTAVPLTAPTVASIPREGVWVRVTSTARYAGRVGNAELMKAVSGTGDNFTKVLWDDRPVEAVVQKQDNSGAPLTVAVYRNGTLIASRTITSPMGTATLLIDPVTARPPGLPANVTPTVTLTTFRLENY